jgi:hypothetical protein
VFPELLHLRYGVSVPDEDEDHPSPRQPSAPVGQPPQSADFLRREDRDDASGSPARWEGPTLSDEEIRELPYLINFLPQGEVRTPESWLQAPGGWVSVSRGGLFEPVLMRINKSSDGRFVVTGLVIGMSGQRELTSHTLRSIKLGAIMRELFKDFDPTRPPESYPGEPSYALLDRYDQVMSWWLMKELVVDEAVPVGASGGDGERPDRYRIFAETYLRELARDPRRAMTATAMAHHISRATANRWAKVCRQRGHLPAKETDR